MNNPFDWRRSEPGRPDPKRIVASLPLAMFLLAPDLTVASVNPAAEQLVGRGARRLQGQPVRDLFEFDEPLILERLADRESHLFARDARVRMPDLTTRELDVITAPVAHFRAGRCSCCRNRSGSRR